MILFPLSLEFFTNLIYFSITILVAFTLPGFLLVRTYFRDPLPKFTIGTMLGMVLWALIGFLTGLLNLRLAMYAYIIVCIVLVVLYRKQLSVRRLLSSPIDNVAALLIIIGMVIQVSTVFYTGVHFDKGMFFCCGNINDSLYHIALTNQLVSNFPPEEPGMIGEIVKNYHYLGNLVVSDLVRIFKLPLILTQYQFFTLFTSLFLGLTAIAFAQTAKLSVSFSRWLLFFLYLGGDLVYLAVSFVRKEINFQMSGLEDGSGFLVNPPRALSIVVFFTSLSLFLVWIKKRDVKLTVILSLLFASLVGFKVYTGLFVLTGLVFVSIWSLLKKRYTDLLLPILTLFTVLVIYLPVNKNAGGLYFTQFALFENFIVQPWLMLDRLELARIVYLEHSSWIRVLQYDLMFMGIFIGLIFGTKLLGLLQTKKSLALLPLPLHLFMASGIVVSLILGSFFQQVSGGSNTFNFLVSVFIIGSIYSALAVSHWLEKTKGAVRIALVIVIILLTIPRPMHQFISHLKNITSGDGMIIPTNDLEAFAWLKTNISQNTNVAIDPRSYKTDFETPYASFFINHPTYISGVTILQSHGINTDQRIAELTTIVSGTDSAKIETAISTSDIDFLLVASPISTYSAVYFDNVFSNDRANVLKTRSPNNK